MAVIRVQIPTITQPYGKLERGDAAAGELSESDMGESLQKAIALNYYALSL